MEQKAKNANHYTTSIGISCDTFLLILAKLYVKNNDIQKCRGQLGYDPLFKICPILHSLTSKFQELYTLEEELTIYEAICTFKGHVFFSVYMKRKYGIKIFQLCEAKCGYVHKI
jgi:hypothetical protein